MTDSNPTAQRHVRPAWGRLTVWLISATLLVGACASESPDGLAAQFLDEGLQAHVAGDLVAAEALYQDCLAAVPDDKFCLYNLGLIAQTDKRAALAEDYYRIALETDPDYAPALFNLAILRTAAGSTDEALHMYRRVTMLQPENAAAFLNLGLLLLASGDQREADGALAVAVRLDPSLGSRIPAPNRTPPPTSSPEPSGS